MRYRSTQATRLSAITMAAVWGQRIQREHPEVVEMYRSLTPFSRIVRALRLIEGYGVSEHVARNAVVYALRGYRWGFGVESYAGLITDVEELDRIVSGYRKKVGKRLRKQKRGICGLSKEERRKAACAGAAAVGWIVFTKKERACALRLCSDPRFCYEGGRHKGEPKLGVIAQELNKRFHNGVLVRTKYSVNSVRGKAKRQFSM